MLGNIPQGAQELSLGIPIVIPPPMSKWHYPSCPSHSAIRYPTLGSAKMYVGLAVSSPSLQRSLPGLVGLDALQRPAAPDHTCGIS